MLTRPNIFNYAKKELSQDAVICWLWNVVIRMMINTDR